MSKPKSYIKCPKCGNEAHKVYDLNEIEKAYPNDVRMQVMMKREYICSDTPCSHVFPVSLQVATRAFIEKRNDEGKTIKETLTELEKEKQAIKDRFTKDEGTENEN